MMSEALLSERKSGPGWGNSRVMRGVREINGGGGDKKAQGSQTEEESEK